MDNERGPADSKDMRVSVNFASTKIANLLETAVTGLQTLGGDSIADNSSVGLKEEKNARTSLTLAECIDALEDGEIKESIKDIP